MSHSCFAPWCGIDGKYANPGVCNAPGGHAYKAPASKTEEAAEDAGSPKGPEGEIRAGGGKLAGPPPSDFAVAFAERREAEINASLMTREEWQIDPDLAAAQDRVHQAENRFYRERTPTVTETEELEYARRLLVFADGLAVANTGFALADLYAEDCAWAQETLRSAGCHPRGVIPTLTKGRDLDV